MAGGSFSPKPPGSPKTSPGGGGKSRKQSASKRAPFQASTPTGQQKQSSVKMEANKQPETISATSPTPSPASGQSDSSGKTSGGTPSPASNSSSRRSATTPIKDGSDQDSWIDGDEDEDDYDPSASGPAIAHHRPPYCGRGRYDPADQYLVYTNSPLVHQARPQGPMYPPSFPSNFSGGGGNPSWGSQSYWSTGSYHYGIYGTYSSPASYPQSYSGTMGSMYSGSSYANAYVGPLPQRHGPWTSSIGYEPEHYRPYLYGSNLGGGADGSDSFGIQSCGSPYPGNGFSGGSSPAAASTRSVCSTASLSDARALGKDIQKALCDGCRVKFRKYLQDRYPINKSRDGGGGGKSAPVPSAAKVSPTPSPSSSSPNDGAK